MKNKRRLYALLLAGAILAAFLLGRLASEWMSDEIAALIGFAIIGLGLWGDRIWQRLK